MTRALQLLRALAASPALAPRAGDAAVALCRPSSASVGGALFFAATAAARGLRGSASRLGMGLHMSDNDPVVLELEKKRNLNKAKLPAGGGMPDVQGWNEALASDSEAVVRPDGRAAPLFCRAS